MAKWITSALFVVVAMEVAMSALCASFLLCAPKDNPFLAGPGHLAYSPEHFLALVAVGIWSGRLGGPAVWALPLSFMAGVGLGFVVGANEPAPAVQYEIHLTVLVSAVSLVVAAVLVLPLPSWEATGTLMMFGMCQGYVDGVGSRAEPLLSGLSFAVTAVALLGLGVGAGLASLHGRQVLRD